MLVVVRERSGRDAGCLQGIAQSQLRQLSDGVRESLARWFAPFDAETGKVVRAVRDHAAAAPRPRLAEVYTTVPGGQDVYFLRKDGVVTDQYWHVWTNTFFRFYAKMPTFLRVFDFAAEEGLLHPEFVSFYRGAIGDETLVDPVEAKG